MALPEEEEEENPKAFAVATTVPKVPRHAGATPGRENPKVFGMAEGVAPILASGGCWGHPSTDQGPKAEGGVKPALPNDPNKTTSLPSKDPYSTSALSIDASLGTRAAALTLPCGFSGVMACLHTPERVEVDLKVPIGIMPIGLLATPGISSMSSSHIVKDKIMGVTYMDTITTSVGRVTNSGPGLEAFPTGPTIEDITDCQ